MRELKLLFLAEKNVLSTEIFHSIVIHENACIETSADQEIHYLFQLLFFLNFFLISLDFPIGCSRLPAPFRSAHD